MTNYNIGMVLDFKKISLLDAAFKQLLDQCAFLKSFNNLTVVLQL
jgi:hypothetical protein